MWIYAEEPKEMLRLNHALDVLGLLDTEDRFEIADLLLKGGFDVQPLIDLHVAQDSNIEESSIHFMNAAHLVGVGFASNEAAANVLVRHIMESIISGRYSPFYGLAWLHAILECAPNADTDYVWGGYDCSLCCGLYWSYEEGPVGRRPSRTVPLTEIEQSMAVEVDSAVIEEAAAWLARNPTA